MFRYDQYNNINAQYNRWSKIRKSLKVGSWKVRNLAASKLQPNM